MYVLQYQCCIPINFTVKMLDQLFLYICKKVENKIPQAPGILQLDLIT